MTWRIRESYLIEVTFEQALKKWLIINREKWGRCFGMREFHWAFIMWIESLFAPNAQPKNLWFILCSFFSHHAKHPISEQVLTKLTPKYIWNLPHHFFLYCSHHGPEPHRLLDYSNGILSGLLTQLLSLHYMFFTQESVNRKVTLFCL